MKELDPTYIKSVWMALQDGRIAMNEPERLPLGLSSLYDSELFPLTMGHADKRNLLLRFLPFALAKRPISVEFASQVTYRIVASDSDLDSQSEKDSFEKTSLLIITFSNRFSGTGDGRYSLYHSRFRTYILQKCTDWTLSKCNDAFIDTCSSEYTTQQGSEAESYALEHMSDHLYVKAMLGNDDGMGLKAWCYDPNVWQRQRVLSGNVIWTRNGLQKCLEWAVSSDPAEVVDVGEVFLKFNAKLRSDVPFIYRMVRDLRMADALETLGLLLDASGEISNQRMYAYIVFLFIITSTDASDDMKRNAASIVLERYRNDIPEPQEGFHLWSSSFIPPLMVFHCSIELRRLGCEWIILWRNFELPQTYSDFRKEQETEWVSRINDILEPDVLEVWGEIVKSRSTREMCTKCHLTVALSNLLLSKNPEKGTDVIRDMLNNHLRKEYFVDSEEDYDAILVETSLNLIRNDLARQSFIVFRRVRTPEMSCRFYNACAGFLPNRSESVLESYLSHLDEAVDASLYAFIESMSLISKGEYLEGMESLREFVHTLSDEIDDEDEFERSLLLSVFRGTDDSNILELAYMNLRNEHPDIMDESILRESFALAFAYKRVGLDDNYRGMIDVLGMIEPASTDLYELYDAVKPFWRELEIENTVLAASIVDALLSGVDNGIVLIDLEELGASLSGTGQFQTFIEWLCDRIETNRSAKDALEYLCLDAVISRRFTEAELDVLSKSLSPGVFSMDFLLSEILPHYIRFENFSNVMEKLGTIRSPDLRDRAYGNLLRLTDASASDADVQSNLLERALRQDGQNPIYRDRSFISVAVLDRRPESNDISESILNSLNESSKSKELIYHAIDSAYRNDYAGFTEIVEDHGKEKDRIRMYTAFIEYNGHLIDCIDENTDENSYSRDILGPITEYGPKWSTHMPDWFSGDSSGRTIPSTSAKEASNNTSTGIIFDDAWNLIKRYAPSSELDGYIMNLVCSMPAWKKIDEADLDHVYRRSMHHYLRIVLMFSDRNRLLSGEEEQKAAMLLDRLLSEHDEYTNTRMILSLYEYIRKNPSFQIARNHLAKKKMKGVFGNYSKYLEACLNIIDRRFDLAEGDIAKITDPAFRDSAMITLSVEAFKARDFRLLKNTLNGITQPVYLEDACNIVAEGFFKRLRHGVIFPVHETGVWKLTSGIGRIMFSGSRLPQILASIDVKEGFITRQVGRLLNVWNYDSEVARYAMFKCKDDDECARSLVEAYRYLHILKEPGDVLSQLDSLEGKN